jgi:MFS-type transporter involved in bile tolerance (Atg22 family)
MMLFCYSGVAATCLLFFPHRGRHLFGALIFIAANVCFGASIVYYNSFLPTLPPKINATAYQAAGLPGAIWAEACCSLLIFSLSSPPNGLAFQPAWR